MPEDLPEPPQRLRDLVARPRPFPLRTLILVALVPLVGFTIFVVVTHRESARPPAPPTSTATQSAGVIFVTPVSAPAKSAR